MHKVAADKTREGVGSLSLGTVITRYLRDLRSTQGLAKSTHKSYQSQLRRVHRWLSDRLQHPPLLSDLTGQVLREYIAELSEGGRRPRTVCAAVSPIRSMFNYLVDTQVLDASWVHSVRLPKKDAAQRPHVTDKELVALIDGCDRMADPNRAVMARALLLTLSTTGVRRGELLNLTVADIHRDEARLLVTRGKGSKSRAIPLTEETLGALEAWLQLRPPCKHDFLFVVDANRRLGNLGLDSLLEQAKAAAGLRDHNNIQPHAIRHAAASRVLQRGGDLKSIQTMLGHTNITTTAVYLHVDEEHLRSIAKLASLLPHGPTAVQEQHPHESSVAEGRQSPEGPGPRQMTPRGEQREAPESSSNERRPDRTSNSPYHRYDRRSREPKQPSSREQKATGAEPQTAAGKPVRQPRRVPWALARRRWPLTDCGSDGQ